MTFHIKSQLKNKEQFPSKTGKKWLNSKGSIKKKKEKIRRRKRRKRLQNHITQIFTIK